MKIKLSYEKKPIYKVGDELYCKIEGKNVIIEDVYDSRDYSNQFRPDYKDGLNYDILIDGGCFTGYNWWDFEPKKLICMAPKGECDRKPENVCKECEGCKYLKTK